MKLHSKIRSALRQIWFFSDARKIALARTKVRGIAKTHLCEVCNRSTSKPEVDHIEPCGRTPGSKFAKEQDTWDRFIERLFCQPSGLRVLCKECHLKITNEQKGKKCETQKRKKQRKNQ